MRVIAELEPTRNNKKLLERAKALAPYVDAIDIPDAPMGRPLAAAYILAAYLAAQYPRIAFIPHIRVGDMNALAILNIIGGLKAAGVREAVLLRGDDPAVGRPVDHLTVEEAAALAKDTVKNSPLLGAMLSMRYPMESIARRLSAPLDFYMVLRPLASKEKLEATAREARRLGKKLYAYIIIGGEENLEKLRAMLGDQPVYRPAEVPRVAEELEHLVDGVILSSPGSLAAIVEAAQALARR